MRLTEQTIRKFPTPEKGNKVHYDEEIKGLGLRVTAANARAFILNYRIAGRERRYTLGLWPEWSATAARERAKELRRDIDRGEDPLAEREQLRTDPTFGEVVEEYLRIEASKQKRSKEYARMLEREALPQWRNLRAADIKRRDVIALVEKKAETAPISANRLLELIRRVYNFAIRRDIVEANPCALVQKPGQEHAKDRVLSRDEIRTFWEALDGQWFTQHTAAALRLILLTAQRPGEVIA
ncbi:MAG: integrase arm-type DNA-binding domain-containing protein, partial [Acidobacteria bacterium]|nr:integrase arm-type DNA-binding domain-containing protein [Acidobacteriota bacterium]